MRNPDNGDAGVKTAATWMLFCYYFIYCYPVLQGVFHAIIVFERRKKTLNWHWHICSDFFSIPLQENGFLSLQFIQLQNYTSANSTIWYSLSLFFSLWSKSNHSKWLLMVIIATALYWSNGSTEGRTTKHTKRRRKKVLLVCNNTWFVYLAFAKM